jgi:hypothetical protein
MAAWKLKLEDVETKSADDLADELQERKVDLTQLDLDLTDRLPARPGLLIYSSFRNGVRVSPFPPAVLRTQR